MKERKLMKEKEKNRKKKKRKEERKERKKERYQNVAKGRKSLHHGIGDPVTIVGHATAAHHAQSLLVLRQRDGPSTG